jgi:hypothetical protein
MFISYDADILHRNDAQTWSTKHIEIVRPAVKQYIVDDKTSTIERIIAKKINVIVDNGHPQLRAAAYLMGGYVGAGYIGQQHAIDAMQQMIDGNGYLSQKASIYKQTAKEMINKGTTQPTYLQNR